MPFIKYKHEDGVLHIGEGRFFYGNQVVEVTEKEAKELLAKHPDLVEVNHEENNIRNDNKIDVNTDIDINSNTDRITYTEIELKKLKADEQKQIIKDLGGNVSVTKNENERIALILKLQEGEKKLKGEVKATVRKPKN